MRMDYETFKQCCNQNKHDKDPYILKSEPPEFVMAKIRITIMTENDKYFDDTYSNEQIEATAKKAWQWIFDGLDDPYTNEKATVEKCEVIER